METLVGEYKYTYGAGSSNNREIRFLRDSQNRDASIKAEVYAIVSKKYKKISDLDGNQIEVEMMSTSDKVKALIQERNGENVQRIPNAEISKLDSEQQEGIIKGFEPNGPWRVEITNDFGSDPKFEKVIHLCIFNPS